MSYITSRNDKSPIASQHRLGKGKRGPLSREFEYYGIGGYASEASDEFAAFLAQYTYLEKSRLEIAEELEKDCIKNILNILKRSEQAKPFSPPKCEPPSRKHTCPSNRRSIRRADAAGLEARMLKKLREQYFEKHPEKQPLEEQRSEFAF